MLSTDVHVPYNTPRYFGLIPAAGFGARMGCQTPKQYLDLHGKPMIYHAICGLLSNTRITAVFVVLAPDDEWWAQFDWHSFGARLQVLRCGGVTRAESVNNGLATMSCNDDDWVLVHDAARPNLTSNLIDCLLNTVGQETIGGLLAVPVADTLKHADINSCVVSTQDRANLWQAQTPQMFRRGTLHKALNQARARGHHITDEASAIEAMGLSPILVNSHSSNFKVTFPEDLRMAQAWLHSQLNSSENLGMLV